jgi:molecular chaperone Hsp33
MTDGRYRATVKLRDAMTALPPDATLPSMVNLKGEGRFVVTLDPRGESPSRQPWQGIIPFEGSSVSDMLEHYMARSEQLPTRLWLAADEQRAVGMLLQKLPDEGGHARVTDEDGWNRMQRLAETITRDEMLGLTPGKVLERLFWQEPLHAFDGHPLAFSCTCSRHKVEDMLRLLGRGEVDSIIEERGALEVRCDFCNELWQLDSVECAMLFAASGDLAPGSETRH